MILEYYKFRFDPEFEYLDLMFYIFEELFKAVLFYVLKVENIEFLFGNALLGLLRCILKLSKRHYKFDYLIG